MKKLFLTVIVALFLSSVAFAGNLYDPSMDQTLTAAPAAPAKPQAQPVKAQVKTPAQPVEAQAKTLVQPVEAQAKTIAQPVEAQVKTLSGTIETVIAVDPVKKVKGGLLIVGANRVKTFFVLSSAVKTTFVKGEKVEVKYFVKENGTNEATEVVVLK
jgi:hypothetical protein